MSIDIYWITGSAPAWRVLFMLEVKGLDYQSHILQASKGELRQEWFLALNPRGQVPVLKDGEVVVYETLAVMHYLERQYPDPPLFGRNAPDSARVEQSLHEVLSYLDTTVTGFVAPVFRNQVEKNRASMNKVGRAIHKELDAVEQKLKRQEFLAGPELSAADIVMLPTIQRLKRAAAKAPELADSLDLGALAASYPALSAWDGRVEALPAFEATFPPNWRD